MRLKLVGCEVLYRELLAAAEHSPHEVDVAFQQFGLHREPDKLRTVTQQSVDAVSAKHFDYVVLGYGICSRGLIGIRCGEIPMVIPRAHDCITLLLGSRERYTHEFAACPGTYYYSSGWVERTDSSEEDQADSTRQMSEHQRYAHYVEKYGEDNAKFLIEQESAWTQHYSRTVFINTHVGEVRSYREHAAQVARVNNWEFVELEGDDRLLQALVNGAWPGEEFLHLDSGQMTNESYDESIFRAVRPVDCVAGQTR